MELAILMVGPASYCILGLVGVATNPQWRAVIEAMVVGIYISMSFCESNQLHQFILSLLYKFAYPYEPLV